MDAFVVAPDCLTVCGASKAPLGREVGGLQTSIRRRFYRRKPLLAFLFWRSLAGRFFVPRWFLSLSATALKTGVRSPKITSGKAAACFYLLPLSSARRSLKSLECGFSSFASQSAYQWIICKKY
ncbi:MAG: hypothetical protein LBD68_05200 [Zoogloeaceae bacterium]|jgi:hypothetical protein|nr:hypothetical protein [Zoogloeaceae bacterium]